MVVTTVSPRSLRLLGQATCVALMLVYAIVAWSTIQDLGGAERYVRKADFLIVITGAAILGDGKAAQLYDEGTQAQVQASLLHDVGFSAITLLPFNHPPFEAVLVAMLRSAGLSYAAILALWTLVSLLSITVALLLLLRAWPALRPRGLVVLATLSFFPLETGLLLGQSTAFVLLGWAGCIAALRRGRDGQAGVYCALAALKPQAVPIILLVFLLTRRWRALASFGAVTGAATVAVMPFLGANWPLRYLAFLARYARAPEGPAAPAIEQNWQGLFRPLLGNTPLLTVLVTTLSLLSIALVAWLWLSRPGRHGPAAPARMSLSNQRPRLSAANSVAEQPPSSLLGNGRNGAFSDQRWAFALLVALLVDPHVLPHDLTLAIVPGLLLLAESHARPDRRLLVWLWLGWAFGFAAVLYRGPLPPPAPFWLAITGGWLLWRRRRHPNESLASVCPAAEGGRIVGADSSVAHPG